MTIPANRAEKIADRLPSPAERDAAKQLGQALVTYVKPESNHCLKLTGQANNSTEIILTPGLLQLLLELIGHVANGDAVSVAPITRVLTKQQAADVLNVPVPYLTGLLKTGAISFELVGGQQRVKTDDLFEFKRTRDTKRASALKKLAKSDADFI